MWSDGLSWWLTSGVGPNENIGDIYSWEEWPYDRWPNIILLEFSINAHPKENSVMVRLIDHLEDKYRQAGVKYLPAFMFLDLFNLQVEHVCKLFCMLSQLLAVFIALHS